MAKAEQIQDDNERCLAYPNPPGSHWSRDTVKAYCHYRLQPTLNTEYMAQLVKNNQAPLIDRAVAEYVKTTATIEHSQDTIWRSIAQDFDTTNPQVRSMVDEWKKQSPGSALAYAASGNIYYKMAAAARGGDWADQTPQQNFESMHGLLEKAKKDLAKAVELDPSLSGAYAVMVRVGRMDGDVAFTEESARRGMAVDPASYAIYQMVAEAAEPRWGGSRTLQQAVIKSAEQQSVANPLLVLIRAAVLMDVYDLRVCHDRTGQEEAAYRDVFDQVGGFGDLLGAGECAKDQHHSELAFVFLSEAWRFHPGPDIMQDRQFVAAELDQSGYKR
ncbi:DUF4034 domain-containing protein [Dyella solisilvae]|uniref:DUF4034 domain-containing protein n=1 Tax=Dyella solisilvae TaxID=1920168 RepID=UPI0013141AC8|nr:DUF4034 domain-containing protein [Dyella solisilvae]